MSAQVIMWGLSHSIIFSTKFISMHFNSCKEGFDAGLKDVTSIFKRF
jgi:hypothetical protein